MANRKTTSRFLPRTRTRSRLRYQANRLSSAHLGLEPLEERRLLAPVLSGIDVNDGTLLRSGDVRTIAPTELTFRFNPGEQIDATTLATGIAIVRPGPDGVFGGPNPALVDDIIVTPGFMGIGDQPNEVVVRFASALPDDRYQITVFGKSTTPVTNLAGEPFNNGDSDDVINFELDLGANVVAVVPQPISRVGGVLTQARDQIVVYFNNDDLNPASAENPQFYQLIFTGHSNQFTGDFNTASNADDVRFNPTSVQYDPTLDRAVLTFSADLANLSTGAGTYRLRIGTNEPTPSPPTVVATNGDPGASVSASKDLGALDW